jgi:hypothetical protein
MRSRFQKDSLNNLNKLAQYDDIARFLSARQSPWRADYDDREIPFNLGDWYGVDAYNGYFASLPSNLLNLELHTPRVKDLLGVTYEILREPSRPEQREVYRSPGGLKVYLNPGAFPRAWTVHELAPAMHAEPWRFLQDPSQDLRRKAFLSGPLPQLAVCGQPDRVQILERSPNRLTLEAEMACTGMVVVSEAWFPGWKATVDGRPATIYPAYTALRGVVAGPGKHRIEMRYRPVSVILGGVFTALAIAGACALAAASWISERRHFLRRAAVPGSHTAGKL